MTYRRRSPRQQHGVVLLFSLIALGIMLIVAVALVRSFNSSLFTAGNIGFKRDMQNQSERAVDTVLAYFRSGGALSTVAARQARTGTYNYSAKTLPTDINGIPLILTSATWPSDFTASDLQSTDQSVTMRYVIDRLCTDIGDETAGVTQCVLANNPTPAGTSSMNLLGADRSPLCSTCSSAVPQSVVYRLSVRVSGPRNTQSYFQSTFTVPST